MKNRILQIITFSAFLIAICSCRKNDEADILEYEIVNQDSKVEINRVIHSVNITFPETFHQANQLASYFLLSEGAIATINGVSQVSGQTINNYELPFSYTVQAEDRKNIIEWKVSAVNNPNTHSWGLGRFLESALSNNKDYEWYIDQINTGVHSYNNCGPTSTTMASKWSDPAFSKTPVDARAAYRPEGGWWYTSDIDKYLKDNSIPHFIIGLSSTLAGTQQIIAGRLDEGYIVILCLDMYYIRSEGNTDYRVDKFYNANTTGWGHFIIVKGYKTVDGQFFCEVYDPYSLGKIYPDGMLKGRNRYYRSSDIFDATSKWWNYAIIIAATGTKKAAFTGLDPATIPHMWGR
jgi:hypothetical protein